MNLALVYLMLRSMRGKVVHAIRLLKQPKYLIGILVGFAWMAFWLRGFLFRALDDDSSGVNVQFGGAEQIYEFAGDIMPATQLGVALIVALLISLWWLIPWGRIDLSFTEAEIHMLAPLPLKRRHLIQYATLKTQRGILFLCLMLTIFLGTGGPLKRVGWYVSFWLVLTLWDLHSKGRSLWLERQKELTPERAWRNRLLLAGAILLYWTALGAALSNLVGELMLLRPAPDQEWVEFLRATTARITPEVQASLLGWLLFPFVLITAPLFLGTPGVTPMPQVAGLLMPVLLVVAHNEWVVRSRAKFEEAALAHARREASKQNSASRYWKTSIRSRQRTPFPLPPLGAPELAILWKNSMIVTRYSYRTLLFFGLAVVGIAFVFLTLVSSWFEAAPYVIGLIGLITMAISPLTGSQSYRNDLRADLLRVEMVRPWPIEGWKLFAVETAGPTVFATMSAILGAGLVLEMSLFITINQIALPRVTAHDVPIVAQGATIALGAPISLLLPLIVLGVLPLVVALICLSAALQNLLVLLFPGWVQLGARPQGPAVFGQNMIMFFGLGLATLLCLLPAALLIGVIIAIQWFLFEMPIVAWEFPVFGIVAATPVLAAVALIVRGGGRIWDNLDPSREVLEGRL